MTTLISEALPAGYTSLITALRSFVKNVEA